MKILDVLVKEVFDFNDTKSLNVNNAISISDLDSLQLRTLNRLNLHQVDLETASEKELNIILDLIDLGLVNDDGDLTDAGKKALEPASINTEYTDKTDNPETIDDIEDDDFDDDDNFDDQDGNLNRFRDEEY